MRCIAFLRCGGLVTLALSLSLGAGAEPPSRSPVEPNAQAEPSGVLTLNGALAAALLRNPELAADAFELRAREAAELQSAAFPNPSLGVEVENIGAGGSSGSDAEQTTVLLGQLVELGGKRAARMALAGAQRELASWDYEMRRIDVLVLTAGAFVEVLAAQERERFAGESLALARAMKDVASRRLRAGIASPAEEIRAAVQVDVAEVELEHGAHELATARQALAASWGGETPAFERAEGDLERLPAVPSESELARRLEASPAVARWQSELAERQAQRDRARSERIPDVALSAGPRWIADPAETALVVGVSLPLPLWNRNAGAIAESEHRLAKLSAQARAARVRAVTALAAARIGLSASSEEAELLRTRVLPGTEQAVAALRRGYEQGRFAQVEVLDAERARLEARAQYLRALIEAHHSAEQIERLTGVPLEVRP